MHFSLTLEDKILGGMMRHKASLATGLSLLHPKHFQTEPNRVLFQTIVALHESGSSVDLVHVVEYLGVEGVRKQPGRYFRLASMWIDACPESDFQGLVLRLLKDQGDANSSQDGK
jgi:replicative DNA helicase